MKILIIGSVASGKSTYSKKLSKELNIKRYEIDEIVHDDIKHIKRTLEEQKEIIAEINKNDSWIIVGVLRKNLYFLLDISDEIILMDTSDKVRKFRIVKRYIKQKLRIEKCGYKPSIGMVKDMFKWSSEFEDKKKDLLDTLHKYKDKVKIKK